MITTINVYLGKKEDFYSKYSHNKLNRDLTDFILEECYGEFYKNKITINIDSQEKLTDEEKREMMDIIRRTYGLRVQDELYYSEKSQNKKTILLLVGIALIILYYCSVVSILKDIILIIGWLAIWDSIYGLIFDTHDNFVRIRRLKELARARIYFSDSPEHKS